MKARTERFRQSFIPEIVRLWNDTFDKERTAAHHLVKIKISHFILEGQIF